MMPIIQVRSGNWFFENQWNEKSRIDSVRKTRFSDWRNLFTGQTMKTRQRSQTLVAQLLLVATIVLFHGSPNTYANCKSLNGSGTLTDPYQLSRIEDLETVSKNTGNDCYDKHFLMVADIDASKTGNSSYNEGKGFLPIAQNGRFTGSFDGQDFTISNLTINRPEEDFVALIGYADNVYIRDVNLTGADIQGRYFVAGLIAVDDGSNISRCSTKGKIFAKKEYGGGLVGTKVGGVISDSISLASITGEKKIGGLVGFLWNGSIYSSYAGGRIRGLEQIGNLVGMLVNSQVYYSQRVESNISFNLQ